MPQMKTSHILLALFFLICVALFHFRLRLIAIYEAWRNGQRWHRLSQDVGSGFHDDIEAGLSSAQFDLNDNISNSDPRSLDETAKKEIRRLMSSENISFDKARLQYFQAKLTQNGIGADGIPQDSKTVTF